MDPVRRRTQRITLRSRLLALTVVPILGMSLFAGADVLHRFRTVTDMQDARQSLRATLDLLTLRSAMNPEHIASVGWVRTKTLGVSPALVRQFADVDLFARVKSLRADVDEIAHRLKLDTRSGSAGIDGLDTKSHDRIRGIYTDLVRLRVTVNDESSGPAALSRRRTLDGDYASIERELQEVLESQTAKIRNRFGPTAGSAAVLTLLDINDAFLSLMNAALANYTTTSAYVLGDQLGTKADRVDVAKAEGQETAYWVRLESILTPQLTDIWTRLASSEVFAASAAARSEAFAAAEATRAEKGANRKPANAFPKLFTVGGLKFGQVRSLSALMQTDGTRISTLQSFGPVISEQLRREANRVEQSSRSAFQRSLALAGSLGLVSLALAFWTTRSIVRPLRRLERHARLLSAGQLHSYIEPSGPPEIDTVIVALDDLVSGLRNISLQADALSRGALDAPILTHRLPGTLGESLGITVDRWKVLTNELTVSEARASAIVDHAVDAIWMLDEDLVILEANAAAETILQRPADEQIGVSFLRLINAHDGPGDAAIIMSGITVSLERQLIRSDTALVPVLLSSSRVDTDAGTINAVFAHDISERKRFEDRLAYQANHDSLTGLLNRAAAMSELERALVRGRRLGHQVALLFFDLDGFKEVNDTFGHRTGDQLLVHVAERLSNTKRCAETFARFGGDEFLVIIEGLTGTADALSFGDRILSELCRPFMLDKGAVEITASIGVAVSRPDVTAQDLLHEADVAVYEAKSRGRSRVVVFDAEMQRWIDERGELERDLRRGVANSELELYFQPIMDLRSDHMWGVEALVRWHRPHHGLVSPIDFIPVAEESMLIVDLGRWVIDAACRQLAQWADDPDTRTWRVAVNVSGRHLTDADIVGDMQSSLDRHGVDAQLLEVELTETHLLRDIEPVVEVLANLRAIGVGLAIDDFGTGYSSLTYLRRFPVDTMKIDRSFVAEIGHSSQDTLLVEQLLTLARTMDLTVVAEGIETAEQLATLRAMGCEYGQGYFFAKPMTAPMLTEAFSRYSASR